MFSFSSETALFSLSNLQLEQMRRDDNPCISLIERLLSEPRLQHIRQTADGSLIANTRVDTSELEEEIGVEFSRGHYASLAGLLLKKVGDTPAVGSRIEQKDLTTIVISGTAQSIHEARISQARSKRSRWQHN